MWIYRFCSGSVPVRSSSGVSTIKWWKNRRGQIGGGRKGAIPKQKAKASVPQDRQPDRHGPGSVSSSARRTSPTTQPYAVVDLGHEAAGACEAPPHHRRDAGRPGGASTRPYWNGVRRSGGQLPAPPGPRNRRCRAARTPCRLRPRGAAHPADPALADPRASASASKTSTSNQRRVEVARPPGQPRARGPDPYWIRRRHLRARPPRSARHVLRPGPGARGHMDRGGAAETGTSPRTRYRPPCQSGKDVAVSP